MFLSKRNNGIYYLWFEDEFGHKRKVSTHSTLKSTALKFLYEFKQSKKSARIQRKMLSQFTSDFLTYAEGVYAYNTILQFRSCFREFEMYIGDVPLEKICVREIEKFLAKKKIETSDFTARKYYATLSSAFQTAVRWNCIA